MILIGDVTEQPVDSRTESALSGVKQTCSLSHSEYVVQAAASESCSRNVILPEDPTKCRKRWARFTVQPNSFKQRAARVCLKKTSVIRFYSRGKKISTQQKIKCLFFLFCFLIISLVWNTEVTISQQLHTFSWRYWWGVLVLPLAPCAEASPCSTHAPPSIWLRRAGQRKLKSLSVTPASWDIPCEERMKEAFRH